MSPYMRKAGLPFSDTILYKKYTLPKEKLQNTIVAMHNPFKHTDIIFRRIIAEEG